MQNSECGIHLDRKFDVSDRSALPQSGTPAKSHVSTRHSESARSCGQAINSDFAQVITITFAMVVAIYYFLHQAGVRMKRFVFTIYTCGMLAYLGMMLLESGAATGAQIALRAIPVEAQELPTQYYLGVRSSWVGTTSSNLIQPCLLGALAWHRLSALLLEETGRDRAV
jgi:hypothetical protein